MGEKHSYTFFKKNHFSSNAKAPPEELELVAVSEPVVGRYLLHVSVAEEMQLAGLEAVLTLALVKDVGLKLAARTRCLFPRHVASPPATSSSVAQ